ncbi:tyrosine-type recombinase/integrase [Desulfofalx alkaliphila]|uniref:tyrosine-type recombinase/integrase n=1 Tax=Desulfofalx alkaliphila TaxID=105483 RepID=UPI0004E1DF5D|nr:tyrosine-type recombinase/integrase [Desulfofalx alkaliphila]
MNYINDFKKSLLSRGLSKSTVNTYLAILTKFKEYLISKYDSAEFTAVTALDIADYRRYLVDQGKKPATVNLSLDALRSFYKWATAEQIVSINPVTGVKRVPEQENAPKWLERKDLGKFMRAVQKYGSVKDLALINLLLHTGLRISEACSLMTQDVTIRERSGVLKVREGKGSKYRELPLNITIRRVLDIYIAESTSKWLFPGRKTHITTRTAERIISKYGRIADVEVTPHMLRHTFGKMLIDAGESLDRVATLMGHSDLNTTAKYTRPSIHDLEKAVEKLAWE